ncbi:MAG: hypothetical protein AAB495_04170 [Patescibacteria group bacterium]
MCQTGRTIVVVGAIAILASPIIALGAIWFAKQTVLLTVREAGKAIDRVFTNNERPSGAHSISGFSKCW